MDSPFIIQHLGDLDSCLVGFGVEQGFQTDASHFSDLEKFILSNAGKHLFFCLSYDLKNELNDLKSNNSDFVEFPEILCWSAKTVLRVENGNIDLLEGEMNSEVQTILKNLNSGGNSTLPKISFQPQISKEKYLERVDKLKAEIQYGNSYEINFCQQFFAKNIPDFDAVSLWKNLLKLTQAPFSVYLNWGKHQVFCGSPERFLKKTGSKLVSQPIKGTAPRGKNKTEDLELIEQLESNQKERSENVMIVDLVRNDLSRIAQKSTVNVDELCKIYSFGTVHQMISTISCEVKENTTFSDMLKATFPMGSMTGAPKISSMKLIEKHESFKRGLYSGSIGCIFPNGDFDCNVVIRTLIHNKEKNLISASVGGAITMKSDPEAEFEECQVKINKLLALFDGNH